MIPSLVEYLVYLYESSVDCEYHRLHRQKMIDGSNWSTKDGGKKRKRRQFGTRKSRGEETPKNHRIARTSMMLHRRGVTWVELREPTWSPRAAPIQMAKVDWRNSPLVDTIDFVFIIIEYAQHRS